MNQPSHGQFDPVTKTFFNSNTGKWVQRLRPSMKGELVGNALGRAKGNAYLKKYYELGMPQKYLQIPINTDIELIKVEANQRGLNYEHSLFILHKLLYNRVRLRKTLKESPDYLNNYTPLGSQDIRHWIGDSYVQNIKLLVDLKYILPKLSAKGNLSYWNGGEASKDRKTACYKINEALFNKDLFEFKSAFKTVSLNDVKLIVKLHQRLLGDYSSNETVFLLQRALKNVRVMLNKTYLYSHFLPEIAEEVSLLINDINNGEIYVKEQLDPYGERFHSTFTNCWATLRPLIYFNESASDLIYLDLSNSQYFFFTLLRNSNIYTVLLPEYADLEIIISKFNLDESFNAFCQHAQNATLYNYIYAKSGLTKIDLMKVFFAKSSYYKQIRLEKLPWLQSLIESIEAKFGHNILPEVLQKLESRNVLQRICAPFLKRNEKANLISIHDGILFESNFYGEIVEQINTAFSELNFPIPKFKLVTYENPKSIKCEVPNKSMV